MAGWCSPCWTGRPRSWSADNTFHGLWKGDAWKLWTNLKLEGRSRSIWDVELSRKSLMSLPSLMVEKVTCTFSHYLFFGFKFFHVWTNRIEMASVPRGKKYANPDYYHHNERFDRCYYNVWEFAETLSFIVECRGGCKLHTPLTT